MKKLVLIIITSLMSINCFAWLSDTSDDKWRSGFGQGIVEAEVTQGSGNKIEVVCSDPDNSLNIPSSISVTIGNRTSSSMLMVYDGGKPEEISLGSYIDSSNHVGADYFLHILEKFKKHKKVYIRFADGSEATFTLKGAKAVVDGCKPTFYG